MKKKSRFLVIIAMVFIVPVAMMMLISMSGALPGVIPSRLEGPCDIYSAAGTPCVAAHSSTRALYASYNGPLYQVMRQSDGKTLDIGVVQPREGDPGGYADAAAQDAFCANTICLITKIYDQSVNGNDLLQAPPGTFMGPAKGGFNNLPIADMAPVTISGHKAYGVYIIPGMGLRNNNAKDIAINDEPEGIYYVINGKHYDSGCCFDYGNSSTNGRAVGTGTMETTYYGTATAWGSGNGPGPWIMADMEAGLFSGYNAKKNDVPTIDSWRFISAFVGGGGGNKWDLRGGNAQEGSLITYYSGVRPGTPDSKDYFPMNKKGGILLGNGGDNGNGSSGTFYEGVMTTGHPDAATTDKVQTNIVAARYDVQRVSLSRILTFTPKSVQEVTETFVNTTGGTVKNVKLSISVPKGWMVQESGSSGSSKTFVDPIAPNASVSVTFKVTSPTTVVAGYLTGKVEWTNQMNGRTGSETATQRIRNVFPVKINEICFSTGSNPTYQFIELYNASTSEVDISNWNLISTRSEWAPVKLGVIPAGTKLAPRSFYLLGLSASGLVAPVNPDENIINVRSTDGLEIGQQISIDGETCTIANVGTPASPMTTMFIPVSTGPWLTVPSGSTNLPVTNAAGFTVGQKIGIDLGGNYEVATVTHVGKASTQTNLAVAAKAGDRTIKVAANSNMTNGDTLIISTGARKEIARVKRIINVVAAQAASGGFGQGGSRSEPGEVELVAPLRFDHMLGVDVSDKGTGISFTPATRFVHRSGDAVQALGSGITLENKLNKKHETGAPVVNTNNTTVGYQGLQKPNQWYGNPLSTAAGSLALMAADNVALVDAVVFGSQQSSSSANGTVASPEIATLEGDQSQGGCIVVTPSVGRGIQQSASAANLPDRSVGRFPDGADSDNNCSDFLVQNTFTLSAASETGSTNLKVNSVANLSVGQKIIIDKGAKSETAVIRTIGTAGATTVGTATKPGTTVIPVFSVEGFVAGQTITIGRGPNEEKVVVASVSAGRRRFGSRNDNPTDSITIVGPLKIEHAAGAQVSGSGITLVSPLIQSHDNGVPIAGSVSTPGEPNQYVKKP